MKISYQWINDYCGLHLSLETMVQRLTQLGLEVGQVKPRAQMFTKVVVAEVKAAQPHPNADRLKVCQVFDGKETYDVVCGAPNARAGIKVAFAQVGALLPGKFKIKKSKIRGEVSQGMLCSARELGLGEEHDGIIELALDAPVGENFRSYKNLDDQILNIELTPNRGDCFSLRGIARELCADQNVIFNDVELLAQKTEHQDTIEVLLDSPHCPVFSGCLVKGIDCMTPTPTWMVERLEGSDIRSINLVVDITNYIMITLGQPMHAYDADSLQGNIIVRQATQGDQLTLLDQSKPELTSDLLLITTQSSTSKGKNLGLAGVMGGADCGVSDTTTNIYFEAAHFTPEYIVGKARNLAMQTEASVRFERGVDPTLTKIAISHACHLLKEIAGGHLGDIHTAYHPTYQSYIQQNSPKTLLNIAQMQQRLGIQVEQEFVLNTLKKIGISCVIKDKETVQVESPIYRFDLAIAEDYHEEVARFYGYDNILKNAQLTRAATLLPTSQTKHLRKKNLVKRHLISLGLSEAISYCFVNDKKQQHLFPNQSVCRLLNPISSDMDVMRLSLLPGLLESISYNNHHQSNSLALFELGLCFLPQTDNIKDLRDIKQQEKLAFAINHQWRPRHWRGTQEVDFYIAKGVLESVFSCFGMTHIDYQTQQLPTFMHPGQSAWLFDGQQKIGIIGLVHPSTLEAFDIRDTVAYCELDWSFIEATQPHLCYQSFSIYPKVYRDLAMLVKEKISVKELTSAINSWKIKYLSEIEIFDVYQGDHVEVGMKSVALCFQFQSFSETLSEEAINQSFNQIQHNLIQQLGVVIRSKALN